MDDCRLANLMAVHKESWKEDLGLSAQRNYSPVSLTLVLGVVMEQITLSAILWHLQDRGSGPASLGLERQVLCDRPDCLL